jgi:alpha-1,6-mannosyltransferase
VVASSTSAVGEFLLLDSNEPVGAVAQNNPKSFAVAIQKVLAHSAADRAMPIRCQHQAENYPWSSTLMMMLRLHGAGREVTVNQKRLRAA